MPHVSGWHRAAVGPEELEHMLKVEKLSHAEIAERTGLTASGVAQAVGRYGLARPRADHKWALPWPLKREHSQSKVAKYLRYLSKLAQGQQVSRYTARTAIKWASDLVKEGYDIGYRREEHPNDFSPAGGFFLKKADPQDWHLKKVLEKALIKYPTLNLRR